MPKVVSGGIKEMKWLEGCSGTSCYHFVVGRSVFQRDRLSDLLKSVLCNSVSVTERNHLMRSCMP